MRSDAYDIIQFNANHREDIRLMVTIVTSTNTGLAKMVVP